MVSDASPSQEPKHTRSAVASWRVDSLRAAEWTRPIRRAVVSFKYMVIDLVAERYEEMGGRKMQRSRLACP